MVHTVKGFSTVDKAGVFLVFSCFLYDPTDVANLISRNNKWKINEVKHDHGRWLPDTLPTQGWRSKTGFCVFSLAGPWKYKSKGKSRSVLSHKSCPNLCDPMDCSLPDSSVHEFPRQEYWISLPFPSSGNLLDSGIEPTSPGLAGKPPG